MRKVYERRAKEQNTSDILKAIKWLKGHGNRRYAGMMLAVLTAEFARRGLDWLTTS